MGPLPIIFSSGIIVLGIVWFMVYARPRVSRSGAILHVFERLGRQRFTDLDGELRGILKEKGLRAQDPFLEMIMRADVLDAPRAKTFESIVRRASDALAAHLPVDAETITRRFLEGTRIGATPVAKGTALPHTRLAGIRRPYLVLARAQAGVTIDTGDVLGETHESVMSYAIFFLVSPDDNPGQHLRLLAELASRVDQEDFQRHWQAARDDQQLRETVLRHERYVSLPLERTERTEPLIDRAIRDLDLPKGSLVAVVRRGGESIVPGGDTVLRAGDRLTIIGSEESVRQCIERYSPQHSSLSQTDDQSGDQSGDAAGS